MASIGSRGADFGHSEAWRGAVRWPSLPVMFVRTLDDVRAAGLEVVIAGGSARTARFLTASDGVGFAFSDVHQGAGGEAHLWYKHHWEANYIVDGVGELEEVATGMRWRLEPGT